MTRRPHEAGFTLVELMISLTLFALVSLAGLALVDGTLGTEARVGGRLERHGDLQRTAYVLSADLQQLAPGKLASDGGTIRFRRHLSADPRGAVEVHYVLDGTSLIRSLGGLGTQRLLAGVRGVRWRFYAPDAGWTDHWPLTPEEDERWPALVAVEMQISDEVPGMNGLFRRVVALPDQP